MKNLTRYYESDLDFGIGAHTLKMKKEAEESDRLPGGQRLMPGHGHPITRP
jgi:hypothetical protein